MAVNNAGVGIDQLEQGLLVGSSRPGDETDFASCGNFDEEEQVLYAASFVEAEENYVKYQTAVWVLYSLLLILAWGIGIVMLLYLPIRRYILLKDFRSRKLYVTPNAIVYKVTKPVPFPFFGVLKKEKHIVLPSVADVVIEQGYLQSKFGVYSVRIENIGVRRPASDDVKIQGIANPRAFRKAVMLRISNMRRQVLSRQTSVREDSSNVPPSKLQTSHGSFNVPELVILQKLGEVGCSVKRVQSLVESQHRQALSEHRD